MQVPPQIRKRLDTLADEAVKRAQEMIKANPEISPTLAYKLAFTWQLEQWTIELNTKFETFIYLMTIYTPKQLEELYEEFKRDNPS